MTPFKIKVSVDHYQSIGYNVKIGDKLYHKDKIGNFVNYAELISFDEKQNLWLGKTSSLKSCPVAVNMCYIDLVVVPLDQYINKVKEKAINLKK